jgi:transcriptional regulator with XRE-family HTH domain
VMAREELVSLLLHKRIAAVINRAGLTQEAFGLEIGVDRPAVNAWVKGRRGVSQDYAQKIAAFASRVYGEDLPAELFVSDRQTPLEEASAQLAQTGQDLTEATRALVSLLEEQRLLVQRMQRIAVALERKEAASEGGGGGR